VHGGSDLAKIALDMGIGHVQARHDLAFECFHLVGLPIGFVIVPAEMEKAVYREMSKVVREKPIFGLAFPFERLVGDDDVAKQPGLLTARLT
jgi:hypothetical protein